MPNTLTEKEWKVLLDRINQGKCTPFLGAGATVETLPLASQIAKEWAKVYDFPLKDSSTDLAKVAQYIADEYDPIFPKDKIVKLITESKPPTFSNRDEPHSVLAALPLPLYMTTNYDPYMAQALRHHRKSPYEEVCRWNSYTKRLPSVFEMSDFQASTTHPVVFHLHGHVNTPQSLVLSEDDYLDFLVRVAKEEQYLLPAPIQEAWAGTSLLFMGYRLSDWNFKVLFRSMVDLERSLGRVHIAVQLLPGDGEFRSDKQGQGKKRVQEYLSRYFKNQSISVFWGECREFAKELRERWESEHD